jgi:hypothetical protein
VPGNGLYVDLDGYFKGGRLETRDTFQLTPGSYTFSFDLAGSQRGDENTVEVFLGSVYSERITLPSDAPFQPFIRTIEVTQSTSARLTFDQFGDDGFGLLLDRVGPRPLRKYL